MPLLILPPDLHICLRCVRSAFYSEAMTFEELKDKALSLPYEPGVYIMQDKTGTVIYVGKAKSSKPRQPVFQDTAAHTPKTRKWCRRSTILIPSSRARSLRRWCSNAR